MKRVCALTSVLILLFLTTSGCINIYLAKDLLVPHEVKKEEYIFQNYHIAGNFTSSPPPGQIIELKNEQFTVEVKPKTQQMRIDISINMRSADEVIEIINDTLPEGQFKDLLMAFLEQALEYTDQRYIEITIKLPDGFELYKNRFNQSAELTLDLISSPTEGTWTVDVQGAGIGFSISGVEYQDSFSLNFVLKELKE